jgi:hypothetical protein
MSKRHAQDEAIIEVQMSMQRGKDKVIARGSAQYMSKCMMTGMVTFSLQDEAGRKYYVQVNPQLLEAAHHFHRANPVKEQK